MDVHPLVDARVYRDGRELLPPPVTFARMLQIILVVGRGLVEVRQPSYLLGFQQIVALNDSCLSSCRHIELARDSSACAVH